MKLFNGGNNAALSYYVLTGYKSLSAHPPHPFLLEYATRTLRK